MHTQATRRIVCPMLVAGAVAHAGAQMPPMSAVTPQRAMFVLEIEDFEEMVEAAERSRLLEILKSEDVQRLAQAYAASQAGEEEAEPVELEEVLGRLGVDVEELSWPAGRVGASAYLPWSPDDLGRLLGEGEEPQNPVVLFSADFGENAGEMDDVVERFVDYGLEHDLLEVDSEQTIAGSEVLVLVSLEHRRRREVMEQFNEEYAQRYEEAVGEGDWEAIGAWYRDNVPTFENADDPVAGAIADAFASVETLAYTWVGDALVLGTDFDALADAVEAGDAGIREAAAGAPWYLNAFSGLASEPHARLALNADLFLRTFVEGMLFGMRSAAEGMEDFDPEGAAESTRATLAALGLDAMEGLGVTLLFDPADAVAEMGLHLHVPEQEGLFRLIADPAPFEPPAFITGDSMSVSRAMIAFPRIMDVAQSVIEQLPAEQRQMARAQFEQTRVIAEPILAEMGPEVYFWKYRPEADAVVPVGPMGVPMDPFGGQDIMVGIRSADTRPLSDMLNAFGQHIQLAPREFAGAQIFETEFVPIALGVGNGWIFAGRSGRVEDAMRLAGPGGQGGADLRDLNRAFEGIDTRAEFLSWSSTRREIEATYDRIEALPEEAPEGEWWQPTREPWMDELPDREWLLERLGDVVSVLRRTDDGLTGSYRMLEPEE